MEENNIISKIQKLISKAESAKDIGNVQEAAIFSAKVSELLLKYNLEQADIGTQEESAVSDVELDDLNLKKQQGGWTINLLSTICKYNFCKPIYNTRSGGGMKTVVTSVTIIGEAQNVEIVKYLYSMLRTQFERMSKDAFKEYIAETRSKISVDFSPEVRKKPWKHGFCSNRGTYLKSFYLGAVNGISNKLEEANQEAKIEHGSKITDLMIVKDSAISDFLEKNYPDLGTMKNRVKKVDPNAFNKGKQAGLNASLAKGVANGTSVPTKMLK